MDEAGRETGLALTVEPGARPGVVLESLPRRLRLVGPAGPLLWASVLPYGQGVWLLRADVPPAVVAPIRAVEARAADSTRAWTRWFARALGASASSPLGSGAWCLDLLRPGRPSPSQRALGVRPDRLESSEDGLPSPARGVRAALELPALHCERWRLHGSGCVVPLRTPSSVDAARVKAWRTHALEGTLPPLLLWWVGALDAYLLLDGHDRLVAAVAEGVPPTALALWQPRPESWTRPGADPARRAVEREYARAFARDLSLKSRQKLNERLVQVSTGEVTWTTAQTRARWAPDVARWEREVRAAASGVEAMIEGRPA